MAVTKLRAPVLWFGGKGLPYCERRQEVRCVDLRLLVQQGVEHGKPYDLRLPTGRSRAEEPGRSLAEIRVDAAMRIHLKLRRLQQGI